MYEVFAVISDEHGSRYVPTGYGSMHRTVAENLRRKLMMAQPAAQFFIEYTNSEDEFNAY